MLIGRNLRKTISQAFAFAAFRWIAVWFLVGACASHGDPVGTSAALVIVAMDIIAHSGFTAMSLAAAANQRREWANTLTNRIFYRLLWEDIRDGGPQAVDVKELFSRAEIEAVADINKADEDDKIDSGWLDSTTWHWFGGVVSFVGQIIAYYVYYGSAFWVFGKHSFSY